MNLHSAVLRVWGLRLVSLAGLLCVAPFAAAAPASPAAAAAPVPAKDIEAYIAEGLQAFEAKDFEKALWIYERGRALTSRPWPALEFAIGRTLQELGRPVPAMAVFESLLQVAELPAGAKARVIEQITRLRAEHGVGRLQLRVTPDGTAVAVDGRPVGNAPLPAIELLAGQHTVRLTRDGYAPAEESAVVPAGGEAIVAIDLTPLPPPPPPVVVEDKAAPTVVVPVRPRSRYFPWTWVTLASGVAAVAGGTVSYVLGERDHREITGAAGYSSPDRIVDMPQTRAVALDERGDLRKTVGYAFWGVGSAAVVTAVVLFVVEAKSRPAEPPEVAPLTLAPVGPAGAGLTLGGAF